MQQIPANAPSFSLRGKQTGRIVSLHDGDTFTCILQVGENYYKFSVRLAGIDTCEMTSHDTFLKTKAYLARNKLFQLLTDTNIDTMNWRKKDFDDYFQKHYTQVILDCGQNGEMDKYGRVIACVSNFSDVLVREKFAFPYDGGKKLTEEEQKKYMSLP